MNLFVGHVHHGLRGTEADDDAALVGNEAELLDIPCFLCRLTKEEIKQIHNGNLEEEARRIRYSKLMTIATENGCNAILTAHTKSDQAETVLHRISRSTGLAGLCGILPVRTNEPVPILRPFLGFTREEILQYASFMDIRYRTDSMNHDLAYTRVRIRERVLPFLQKELNPSIVEALAHLSQLAQEEEKYWQSYIESLRKEFGPATSSSPCSRKMFHALSRAEQRRLLRWYCLEGSQEPSFEQIEMMINLINADKPQGEFHISSTFYFYCRYNTFYFAKPKPLTLPIPCQVLTVPGRTSIQGLDQQVVASFITHLEYKSRKSESNTAWFDASKILSPLWIRSREDGDRIIPMGMRGRKKIKKIFQEHQVHLEDRERVPLIGMGDDILWIAGICVSETGKVEDSTNRILELKLE